MMELRDVGRLAGDDVVDRDDVLAVGREQHRRAAGLAPASGSRRSPPRRPYCRGCAGDRARVGGVGRHRDAARRHDREVGDQPFRAVLADQHHPVAGLEPDPLQAVRQRRDLPRRFASADRVPCPSRLPHRNGASPFSRGAGEEHGDEVREMLELLLRPRHPLPIPRPPRLRCADRRRRPSAPFTHSTALALKPGRAIERLWPSACSAGIIASSAVPRSTNTVSPGARSPAERSRPARQVPVDHADDRLGDLRDDRRSARGADREPDLAVGPEDDRRRHRAARPLAALDPVGDRHAVESRGRS